jgi:hypothetical protein
MLRPVPFTRPRTTAARIGFVLPSIRAELDGVAGYSENLANALIPLGWQPLLAGCNDLHPGPSRHEGMQEPLPKIGESAHTTWNERAPRLSAAIADFDPAVISVQFYWRGFHAGGNYFRIIETLRKVSRGRARHAMFHEVDGDEGTVRSASKRMVVRLAVAWFNVRFAPHLSYTNTERHSRQLRSLGVRAGVHAVPGNIPFNKEPVQRDGAILARRDDLWTVVVFGRIQPSVDAEGAVRAILDARVKAGAGERRLRLVSVGRTSYGEAGWNLLEACARQAGMETLRLGTLPFEVVSHVLQVCDAGLCVTPAEQLGKSTAFSAMAEHGLPMILGSDPSGPPIGWTPPWPCTVLGAVGATLPMGERTSQPGALWKSLGATHDRDLRALLERACA